MLCGTSELRGGRGPVREAAERGVLLGPKRVRPAAASASRPAGVSAASSSSRVEAPGVACEAVPVPGGSTSARPRAGVEQ